MKSIYTIFLLLFSASSFAEKLTYEIYEILDEKNEKVNLIAKGEKVYSLKDISSDTSSGQYSYSLQLEKGFSIEAVFEPDENISGFALQVDHENGGFSWDWFDQENGEVFSKRQDCGKVKISTSGLPSNQLISKIFFLKDTCLRLGQNTKPGHHSHKIKIIKGSEFVILP